jgi:hypothetical protein
LKLNGTRQNLVYADDINILGGSVHTVWRNSDVSVVANKETGIEINADKTKYVDMSQNQIAEEFTLKRLTIFPVKEWNSSDIREQP